MKIAMLTNNYRPFVGGVPVSVERQAQELVKLGHEVAVFAPIYGDTKEERQDVIRADARALSDKEKEDGKRHGISSSVSHRDHAGICK